MNFALYLSTHVHLPDDSRYPHKDKDDDVEKALIDKMYEIKVQEINGFPVNFDGLYFDFLNKNVKVSQERKLRSEKLTEEQFERLKKRLAEFCPHKEKCKQISCPHPRPCCEPLGVDVADAIERLLGTGLDYKNCGLYGWRKKTDNVYENSYPILGEYCSEMKQVILYVNNIDDACGEPTYKGVLPTYIHELFHAFFHYVTEKKQLERNYIREIEEAMAEFSTLVFLRHMKKIEYSYEWCDIFDWAYDEIGQKQKSVGDLPAYGFGRFLFDNIPENEAFDWINKYAERLGYIDEEDELVKQYKQMVCPCYPTEPDQCLELLRKILFETKNTIKPRHVNENRNNMKNNAIIESILCLLKGYSVENSNSLKYLLNQSIREYDILPDHRHLSKGAEGLWKKLMPTTENIMKYHYKQMVDCKNHSTNVVELHLYTGNNRKTFKTIILKLGDKYKFEFRQVFHEEHVIPVQAIVDHLVQQDVNTLNAESIKELLDEKLHICVILKDEDGRLPKTKRESFDYQTIIDTVYKDVAGITLV